MFSSFFKKMRAAFLLSALLVFAASGAFAVEVVIATPEEMQGTDVQQITWEYVVHQLLYEPLILLTPDMKTFVPATASEMKISGDNREIVFTIPEGRKFSNGKPLTAEAYKRSFERFLEISGFAEDFAAVEEIKVDGDKLIFTFNSSPAPAMISFVSVYGGAVEVEDAEAQGKDKAKSNAQTYGPMKMDKWVQGSHIRMVPNPDYKTYNPLVTNKGPIQVDAITVRFIPDNFTRVKELQAGDVDMIYNVPGERVETLKKDPNIELYSSLQAGCDILYINPDVPGLSDPAVHEAMMRAINRKELIAALAGTAEERYGILSPAMIGYSEKFERDMAEKYAFDLDAANKILDEAGYKTNKDGIREKDGVKLDFAFSVALDIPSVRKTAPVVQAQLKKIGIGLNIREFERQYINQSCRDDRKYEIATRSYTWADADMLTYLFHTASRYFSYPDVDKLIEDGRVSSDPAVRAEAYDKAQRAIMEKAVCVPLVSNVDYTAYRKSLEGVIFTPIKLVFINDISKK